MASFLQGSNSNSSVYPTKEPLWLNILNVFVFNRTISNRYARLPWGFQPPTAQGNLHPPFSKLFSLCTGKDSERQPLLMVNTCNYATSHNFVTLKQAKGTQASEWLLCGKQVLKHSILNSYCWWKETYTKSVFLTLCREFKWAGFRSTARFGDTHQPSARGVRTLVALQGM